MKKIRSILIPFLLLTSLTNAENLTEKYKQMMDNALTQTISTVATKEEIKKTVNTIPKTIADDVKQIEALRQGRFESTNEFNTRRNGKIVELKNKVKFFANNGSEEYSAGTATMKSYDADKERMQLTLSWNDDLKSVLSETNNLQIVSLNISRDEAKALFGKKKTHYFHVDVNYNNATLVISKMLLYDKYELKKTQLKPKHLKKQLTTEKNHSKNTTIEKYPLRIKTKPSDARVQILNIKPKYYDGIRLLKGKYKIRVSRKGYITKNISISLSKGKIDKIVLKKKKNDIEISKQLKKRCNQGVGDACYKLGIMYSIGKGDNPSLAKTYEYYIKGCERGSAGACAIRGDYYITTGRNYKKAKKLYRKACNAGNAHACKSYKNIDRIWAGDFRGFFDN